MNRKLMKDVTKNPLFDKTVKWATKQHPEVADHQVAEVLAYLDRYGYFEKSLGDMRKASVVKVEDALAEFQGFFGLQQSGVVDQKTLRTMRQPRCGCPDIHRERHGSRAGNLPRWTKTDLTYHIRDYVRGVSNADQDRMFREAFESWQAVCGITCKKAEVGTTPDIVMIVERGRTAGFDGPSGILAYTYLPDGTDRQMLLHMDGDELWSTTARGNGIYMRAVLSHELGHDFGLDHSREAGALMAPTYNPAVSSPQAIDDIPRATARYGGPKTQDTPSTPSENRRRTVTITYEGSEPSITSS